jgi:broad specificity phosphatase PhoE
MILIMDNGSGGPLTRFGPHGQNSLPRGIRRLISCDSPEGDSLQDLVARTANALRFVLERHTSKTETVVFVGHDSVNRALLLQLLDQSLSAYWRIAQAPCAINEIDIIDGRICVQRMNETHHLEGIA